MRHRNTKLWRWHRRIWGADGPLAKDEGDEGGHLREEDLGLGFIFIFFLLYYLIYF
jgi:hypothetical protein